MNKEWKVAVLGAGAIAEAMIDAFYHTGVVASSQIHITNRHRHERLSYFHEKYGVSVARDIEDAATGADLIFLCVKPKDAKEVLLRAAKAAPDRALYISVIAGKSIEWMTKTIETAKTNHIEHVDPRIVRAMPNTSCAVRESATAYSVSSNCSEDDIQTVETLIRAIGTAYPIEESLLNAVTGLSGSGPAYFYYMVEALVKAGTDVGLNESTAISLINQTIYGAAHMLKLTGETPETLRAHVTSPGGTTMAGMAVLDDNDFQGAVRKAVQAATRRATELGD